MAEFEWIHIADFRVAKNKKIFAIMHDALKDGTKLVRVEFKAADVRAPACEFAMCSDVTLAGDEDARCGDQVRRRAGGAGARAAALSRCAALEC